MRRLLSSILAFALVAAPVLAGYDVQVTAAPNLREETGRVAIFPAACPAEANCVWLERKMEEEILVKRYFSMVTTREVRQQLLARGSKPLDADAMTAFASELGADSYLLVQVGHSGKESSGGAMIPTGNTWMYFEGEVAQGSVRVSIHSAKTGQLLLQGEGFGESEWRGKKGVLLKIVKRVLRDAYGSGN